jgi:hypothetical protein
MKGRLQQNLKEICQTHKLLMFYLWSPIFCSELPQKKVTKLANKMLKGRIMFSLCDQPVNAVGEIAKLSSKEPEFKF